jgi:hypothetical protein
VVADLESSTGWWFHESFFSQRLHSCNSWRSMATLDTAKDHSMSDHRNNWLTWYIGNSRFSIGAICQWAPSSW